MAVNWLTQKDHKTLLVWKAQEMKRPQYQKPKHLKNEWSVSLDMIE